MKKLVVLMAMVLGVIPCVFADITVQTKVVDVSSQPPIVGGVISGYSNEGDLKRGILVSVNKNDLEYNNEKTKMDPYFMWKDEDLVSMDSYIVDCTSIGKEQFWTTLRLLKPDKDYYVRSYVITSSDLCIYGNIVEIHSLNFSRWTSGHSDYANVWHAFEYTLFDLITDEIINPSNGFYYSTNENPKTVKRQVGTGYNTCYKFATEWNYKLWYYHSSHSEESEQINPPLASLSNGKLFLEQNPLDANKNITIYYCVNGNYFRPETYTDIYTTPIEITKPCVVNFYAISSDGYISYSNMYVVSDTEQGETADDNSGFSLVFKGETLQDGSTILINAEGWSGLGSIYTDPDGNTKNGLFVFVNKGGKVSGSYSLEILSNTLNGDLKWSMGGETYALNEVTKLEKSFSTDENGIASVKFSAENIPNEGSLSAKLTVTIGNKTKTFYLKVDFKKKDSPDLTVSGKVGEPVDLGLSVKWASWNVGAGAPEEYGNHYAWGELEPKTDYSASTYKFYDNGYTKYGSIDSKYELDEADDVARQKWGENWRMPTISELKELYEKCSFSNETYNGVPVTKVTGPNDNYIYMPGPGNFTGQTLYFKNSVGSYWSRDLETDSYAKDLDFFTGYQSLNGDTRYHGQSVRPVYVEKVSGKAGEPVDLGLTSGTLWASCNIGASSPEEFGAYFAWGETAPKSNYDWSTYKFGGGSNFTKYNSNDGLTELELQDDAAYVILGEGWRMPTHQQEIELANECSWESTTLNGVSGYKITGPNGNSIFMPRGGLYDGTDYDTDGTKVSDANTGGWYWSSTLNAAGSSYAQGLCFFPSLLLNVVDHERCDGHNIRPVYVGNAQQMESVKIADIGKTTYCSNYDLDFTNVQGIKAYIAIGYDDIDKTIWLARVMKVPAGTGLLVKGDPGTYKIPHAEVQSAYANWFVGNLGDAIKIEETDGDKTNYYLSGKDGTFVSVNGSANIGKNKAYLQLPTSVFGGTRSIGISYDDEDGTTGVKEVKSGEVKSDEWFTLQGQRVAKPGKGVYIHNGHKVVIRSTTK